MLERVSVRLKIATGLSILTGCARCTTSGAGSMATRLKFWLFGTSPMFAPTETAESLILRRGFVSIVTIGGASTEIQITKQENGNEAMSVPSKGVRRNILDEGFVGITCESLTVGATLSTRSRLSRKMQFAQWKGVIRAVITPMVDALGCARFTTEGGIGLDRSKRR